MKGFALVEILVAASIFLIATFAVYSVMDAGKSAWFSGDVSAEIRQEMIKAFMRMEKELKGTRPAEMSLAIDTSSPSITFKMPQDIDDDGTILDSLGRVEWSGDITYALNGNGEITRTAAGLTSVVAHNITDLQFTRPETPVNVLRIDIAAQKTSAAGKISSDSGQIIIKTRN